MRQFEDLLGTTIEAVVSTMGATTGCEVRPGKPFTRSEAAPPSVEIGAVVGIVGQELNGSLLLGMPMKTFLGFMSRMFGTQFTEMVPDIADGPAELLNMILGHVKTTLNSRGYGIKQAIPSILSGDNIRIGPSAAAGSSVVVPCQTELGAFHVELTLGRDSARASK